MRPISIIVTAMLVLPLSPALADPDQAHAFLTRLPAPPAHVAAAKARCGGQKDSLAPLRKELHDRQEDMRRGASPMTQQEAMAAGMAMQHMKPADINALIKFQQQGAQNLQELSRLSDRLFKQPKAALDAQLEVIGAKYALKRKPCLESSADASCFDNVTRAHEKKKAELVQKFLKQMGVNWAEWINAAKDSLRTEARLLVAFRSSSNPALRMIALEQDTRAWQLVQSSLNEAANICRIGASPDVRETY